MLAPHAGNEFGAGLALRLLGGGPLTRSTGSNLGGHLLGCAMRWLTEPALRLTPRGAGSFHLNAELPTLLLVPAQAFLLHRQLDRRGPVVE